MTTMTYPIAEHFLSPQGEGFHSGTLMHFFRFAGCSVGKALTPQMREHWIQLTPDLAPYQEQCCSMMGEEFLCDTNFRVTSKMSVDQIRSEANDCPTVCLTGGEPLMHNLSPLVDALLLAGKKVHIETSGTIDVDEFSFRTWIAVSPKIGCRVESLEQANEIKVLVGEGFNEEDFLTAFGKHLGKVWVQPINGLHLLDLDNLQRCLDLQRKYPKVRLSSQLQKIWGVR